MHENRCSEITGDQAEEKKWKKHMGWNTARDITVDELLEEGIQSKRRYLWWSGAAHLRQGHYWRTVALEQFPQVDISLSNYHPLRTRSRAQAPHRRLLPTDDPCWGRTLLRDCSSGWPSRSREAEVNVEPWRTMSKKKGMAETKHYTLASLKGLSV